MGKISTHVLNTVHGRPAAGMAVKLYSADETLIAEIVTNEDGRSPAPLIEEPPAGSYRLLFSVGDYFRALGHESPFLEVVPIDFKVEAGQSYHVPLLCSPFSYSTYRGS